MQPETRYADSGGVNIAYQVLGDGPRDLVFVMGWVSNIEVIWRELDAGALPDAARFVFTPYSVRQARHGSFRSGHGHAQPRGAHGRRARRDGRGGFGTGHKNEPNPDFDNLEAPVSARQKFPPSFSSSKMTPAHGSMRLITSKLRALRW